MKKITTVRRNLNQWSDGQQLILYSLNEYKNVFVYCYPVLQQGGFYYTYNMKKEKRGPYFYVTEVERTPHSLIPIADTIIIATELEMLMYQHDKEARELFKQLCQPSP